MGFSVKVKKIVPVAGILLVAAQFNNCSDVKFSEKVVQQKSTIDYEEDLQVVNSKCSNLEVKTLTSNIVFDDPRDEFNDSNFTCDFGRNGNLEEREEYFQATLRQDRGINLPEGAIICDLEFQFAPNQRMEFDDHFLFLINDSVLATSLDTLLKHLPSLGHVPQYEWGYVRGQIWDVDNGDEVKFCLGSDRDGGFCEWPKTEEEGRVQMHFEPFLIKEVMAAHLGRSSHNFSFIMLGDNDKKDCQHDRLEFDFKVDYVVPK